MILPDVNLLIYAVDETSAFYSAARSWWDEVLSSTRIVGLCYPSMLGFIRLATNQRVFASPLSVKQALDYVDSWLAQPNTTIVVPTPRHWPIFKTLLSSIDTGANLTTDAHIATLAIEHGYTVYSNDADFSRIDTLRWENPLR